jgi:hypothetical protein
MILQDVYTLKNGVKVFNAESMQVITAYTKREVAK